MRKSLSIYLTTCIVALLLTSSVVAQDSPNTKQTIATSLYSLPDADVLIYLSPQRIVNEAAPKVMPPADVDKMKAAFFDMKRAVGIDPATVDYLVLAVRFQKPSGELSFVAPDVVAVMGGDFSSVTLLALIQQYLQEKSRTETYGARTIGLVKIDDLAEEAQKTPMLKTYVEMAAVPLGPTSLAIGTLPLVKAAADAADGNGRINAATVDSLMRDPNALVASSGSPLAALAKSFGMFGTETTARDLRCDTRLGNFYGAITMGATHFNLRGAMNADNPDTAKIISGLLAWAMQQGIDSVPDKTAQDVLKQIRMTPKESEILLEGDVPLQTVAEFFKPKPAAATPPPADAKSPATPPVKKKATQPRTRRKRTVKK